MSNTVLDSIALGYQPVWNRRRALAAVRLGVHTVLPDAIDAEHLMSALGDGWPSAAPVLILALDTPVLLQQALAGEAVPNTWLEVPAEYFNTAEGLARLAVAQRRGHQLLRRAELAEVRGELIAPLDARCLLRPSPGEALEALKARPTEAVPVPGTRTPIKPGQIYEGIASQSLADHCLDEAGAWGVAGWPDEDVLHAWRHRAMGCDAAAIAQIRMAIEGDCSLDQLERFVRQDPVLVYRLLLLVNSAAFGGRHEVESIRHALMMLGFSAFGRWLGEQLAGSDDAPALHPVRYAQVMRSRLAQHLLEPGAEENLRAQVYTTALFAQLDRLLHAPLAELLNRLPLAGRVFDALLRSDGPYFALLDVARAQGDADHLPLLPAICEAHGMSLEHANRALIRMLSTSRDLGPGPTTELG